MTNIATFPLSIPSGHSNPSKLGIALEKEAMESARDLIQDVLAKLTVIQNQLAKAETVGVANFLGQRHVDPCRRNSAPDVAGRTDDSECHCREPADQPI